MNTINSTKLIELANADYDMLKEKGKEGEKVLHYNGFLDGFAHGFLEASNPWHKASEELPPYDKVVIVVYDGYTEDCCFNHRSNNPEVKTSENGWCDVGYDTEPTRWMEIPEIKED